MGRPRKPLAVQEQSGRRHISTAERERRLASEARLAGPGEKLDPPGYLTTKVQRERFRSIVALLRSASPMLCTEPDLDAVARYVMEEAEYLSATNDLKAYRRNKRADINPNVLAKYQALKNSAFKCVTEAARAIGLTVDSRLKFDLKEPEEEADDFDDIGEL